MSSKRIGKYSLIGLACALFFAFVAVSCTSTQEENDDQAKVQEIVSNMTLDQKAKLVIGTWRLGGGFGFGPAQEEQPVEDSDPAYTEMATRVRSYLPGAAGFTAEFLETGITTQVLSDGPAGLRITPIREGDDENTYYCTAFPIATVLASTWDTDLVYSVGQAMGEEVLEYGSDILLAPALNIQRNPLCGRNFEYYSEDPLVAGKMAAAMVNGIQSNGVGTSIKHFAANNSETNRMSVNEIISERALREIYLKGFEIAVKEAQPWTVMSSYNKVNDVYTSESHDLLTKILREDWGFEGYVMTDWGGGSDVIAQMEAGNDLIEPGQKSQYEEILAAVQDGSLEESVLDRNISRMLKIMLKSPRYNGYEFTSKPNLDANAQVTRQAATDGMVLLENKENTLPMPTADNNIAAFGITSYDFISGGTGSGDVNEAYTISLTQGIANAGFETNTELTKVYEDYKTEQEAIRDAEQEGQGGFFWGREPLPEMKVTKSLASEMASKTDVALITIGRNSGEGGDREPIEGDFYLSSTEKDMIKNVTDAFHAQGKKVIVVLNVGGVVETASWKNIPDAVLLAWQPGQEGGNSVMDVLTGKVNPSGRLAVTFPVSYDDVPSSDQFPGYEVGGETDDAEDLSGFSFMRRVPFETVYNDDIYVGYRYYNTFDVPVSYEFGYGLSYTNFEISNLELSSSEFDGSITATAEVTNTGSVAGREVVQIYVSAPDVKLEKPEEELTAFDKTKMLQPGETETLSFTISAEDITSFNEANSSWIIEPGAYTVKAGASSIDIQSESSFNVASEILVETVNKAMTPPREIEKLSKN